MTNEVPKLYEWYNMDGTKMGTLMRCNILKLIWMWNHKGDCTYERSNWSLKILLCFVNKKAFLMVIYECVIMLSASKLLLQRQIVSSCRTMIMGMYYYRCTANVFINLFLPNLLPFSATKIFVNGCWVGIHRDAEQLMMTLRKLRRQMDIIVSEVSS